MARGAVRLRKTGLLLTAGALFLGVLAVSPVEAGYAQGASSDMSALMSRINQLETQIQTLSRSIYRDGKMPTVMAPSAGMAGGSVPSGALAQFEERIATLEDQQRTLTGQLEQAGYDIRQMKTQLEKALADYEMRLQQLEGGSRSAPQPLSGGVLKPASPAGGGYGRQESALAGDLYADETVRPATTGGTLGTLGGAAASGPEALYEQAFSDIRESRYIEAEARLKSFMRDYPSHNLAANAQYWLGETYYVRGDYREAAKAFAQGYQDYPQGQKAADSLLKLGLSLAKMGKSEDACLSFAQLRKEFPSDTHPAHRRALQEMKQIGCK